MSRTQAPGPEAVTPEQRRYWLALNRATGIGPRRARQLLARFGTPEAVFDAPRAELSAAIPTLPPAALAALQEPDWAAVERDLRWLEQAGRHLLCIDDPGYPPQLLEIDDPPPLLMLRGRPALLNDPQIALVGSRTPSAEGRDNSFRFAEFLAASGLTVTSGLALGIDAHAHAGALAGGGGTVAVMGTGCDRIYPRANRELAERILDGGGALLSELPLGAEPRAEHFPRRNRVISGLSLATVVVEAARQSGSLITARLAAEQGREVFAIPGSVHNPMSKGCHALIRDGAKLVESGPDILSELAPSLRAELARPASGRNPSRPEASEVSARPAPDASADQAVPDGEDYRRLLAAFDNAPQAVSSLAQRSGLTVDSVSSMLLILELRGLVRSVPGGLYCPVSGWPLPSSR